MVKCRKKTYDINENIQWRTRPLLNQLRSIALRPLPLLLVAEIALESLLAPWTLARIGNRRKCRHRLILSRILQKLTASNVSTIPLILP